VSVPEPKIIEPKIIEPKIVETRFVEPKIIAPIMFGLMLSLFLANLDQTIVATCLSAIAHDLEGWALLPWVISGYLVSSTATTPIYGRLSDRFGRRAALLTSIGIFVSASALCALATTMPLLIAARVLQGVGGGGLRSITQIVIADIIPPRDRGRYQGFMSTTFLVSTTLGPVLGGLFAEHLSWKWAFWINLPLGAIAFIVISRQLRKVSMPTTPHRIDWAGAILILFAAVPLMIGLSRVEQSGGWSHWSVIAPIVIGLAASVALVVLELRIKDPMLPMQLFANRVFTLGNIGLFAPSMVMTALIIMIPLYYQLVLKRPADEAGLQLIALTGGMSIGSYLVGSAISRMGRAKIFPVFGGIVVAILCALIAYVGLGRSTLFDITCTLLLGGAMGCQINPMMVIVPNGLEIREIATGMSGLTFFRSLAGAFGVAVFTTLLIGRLGAGAALVPGHEKLGADPGIGLLRQNALHIFDDAQIAAFTSVLEHAFASVFILAAVLALTAVVAVALIKERPLRTRNALT
jgi:EmrB/QacA subfamily drug resistance transporter